MRLYGVGKEGYVDFPGFAWRFAQIWRNAKPAYVIFAQHMWTVYEDEDAPEVMYRCAEKASLLRASRVTCRACGEIKGNDEL